MEKENDILTVNEAAKICGVGRVTLWRWIKSGKLPSAATIGGHHRIYKSELLRFILKNRMNSQLRGNNGTRRILIVDDEAPVVKVYSRMLTAAGYQIATAANGFEAGLAVMRFKPHLLLLDLFMPQMDGFEVCRLLKENQETADIKIIAFSGQDSAENISLIKECGADLFLAKPVRKKELIDHISRLLEP